MKLSALNELNYLGILDASGLKRAYMRAQDPNKPEKLGTAGNETLPYRSGNHHTPPRNPRHREFLGFGPGKDDDNAAPSRPSAALVGDDEDPNAHPIDQKAPIQKKLEKRYQGKVSRRKSKSTANWND